MNNAGLTEAKPPFHSDEREAQRRANAHSSGAGIRSWMPQQHQDFFSQLPYIFAGVSDGHGWPLATMLTGAPGFIKSSSETSLRIVNLPHALDPAAEDFRLNQKIGLLGLDLSTRRRNRANGVIAAIDDDGFVVNIEQSFGNCAKYIQRRAAAPMQRAPQTLEAFTILPDDAKTAIARADTFFIATQSRKDVLDCGGLDVSHRGGRPGFIRLDGDVLHIPDYAGNGYFNSLGNALGEPRASLLFLDFESGAIIQLQGLVSIDWSIQDKNAPQGAMRLWRFQITRGWRRLNAIPFAWSAAEFAPTTESAGIWT